MQIHTTHAFAYIHMYMWIYTFTYVHICIQKFASISVISHNYNHLGVFIAVCLQFNALQQLVVGIVIFSAVQVNTWVCMCMQVPLH